MASAGITCPPVPPPAITMRMNWVPSNYYVQVRLVSGHAFRRAASASQSTRLQALGTFGLHHGLRARHPFIPLIPPSSHTSLSPPAASTTPTPSPPPCSKKYYSEPPKSAGQPTPQSKPHLQHCEPAHSPRSHTPD